MKNTVYFLILTLLGACAMLPSKQDFPREEVKNITIGKTTQKEVYEKFGVPIYHGERNPDEPWWMYIHTKDNNSESLSLYFDKNGKVADFNFSPYRQTLEEKMASR